MNVYTMVFTFYPISNMNKPDAIRLRRKVQKLARQGMPAARIARELGVSRPFVHQWRNATDPTQDQRGWEKGRKREYTDQHEQHVLDARAEAEQGFFSDRMP